MNSSTNIVVEWDNKRFNVDVSNCVTVEDLKLLLSEYTQLKAEQHYLSNLKYDGEPVEDCSVLHLTPGFVLLVTTINDSLTFASSAVLENALHLTPFSENKPEEVVQVRREEGFKILAEPRPGKKLVIFDIDLTIFDNRVPLKLIHYGKRPYLKQLLIDLYEEYDIGLWSATGPRTIECKVHRMGIAYNKEIMFYANKTSMTDLARENEFMCKTKQLQEIWKRFPQYDGKNTLLCDDQPINFILNPRNGLLIKKYRYRDWNTDKELLKLASYLKHLALTCADFSATDHTKWRQVVVPDS